MGFVQRQLVKWVMGVVTYPKVTVVVCAILLLAAVAFSWFHLGLSTDQNELLTPKLKFFRDYADFATQFPENESFVLILEPKDYAHPPAAKRWIALADQASAALMALKGEVKQINSHVPLRQLGEQGLLFDQWQNIKSRSAQMRDFLRLAKTVGEAPSLADSIVLGSNTTSRFFNALALGPAKDAREVVSVVAGSLVKALKKPPESWQQGAEIPDLTDADPIAQTDPSQYGYNMIADETKRGTPAYQTEKIMAINVYTLRDYSSLADVTEPLNHMRAAVERVARDFPEFKKPVITGRPALEADEMATSDRDTRIAEICGLSMVFIVLLIFLRNLWLVLVAEICLGVGIGWTFGWAALSVGRLNLLSLVFVIALIGIGMDYLIQILTRYRFEKRRYIRPQAIWARVFRYVSAPISTACLGAAGAFMVSMLTDFRGAAELGLIAGGGLLLCLVAGYTLLPALLTLFPARVGVVSVTRRYHPLEDHPRAGGLRLIPAALWIIISLGGLWVSLPPQFDANLLKLQADGLPSVREVRKLPSWYAVVLSQDLDKLRHAREALAPGQGDSEKIDRTDSVLDAMDKQAWLAANNADLKNVNWRDPPAPSVADLHAIADAAQSLVTQWQKQPDAGDLSALKDTVTELRTSLEAGADAQPALLERLNAWQHAFLAQLRGNLAQFTPPPLNLQSLPPELRDHYVSFIPSPSMDKLSDPASRSASPGTTPTYALYIYPKADLWETGELKAFVDEVKQRTPSDVLLTGIAPQLYDSTLMIRKAFRDATIYALVLICIFVLLDLRSIAQTLLAISVLALGLPMLLLLMWVWRTIPFGGQTLEQWSGIPGTWNFANFFGLPILIGAGHEYGVFLVHRYRETLHDPRRVWRAWDVSDRALLLCGIVTSASFGFLIAAKHHGLASLGWVMCVGTACIYLAGLLVLRTILQWLLKHKGVYYQNNKSPRVETLSRD